jgi:hypothetical protein
MRTLAFRGLASAQAMADAETRPPVNWFEPTLAIGRALVAARRGLSGDAKRILRAEWQRCEAAGLRLPVLYLAATASRVGAPDLAVEALGRGTRCACWPPGMSWSTGAWLAKPAPDAPEAGPEGPAPDDTA